MSNPEKAIRFDKKDAAWLGTVGSVVIGIAALVAGRSLVGHLFSAGSHESTDRFLQSSAAAPVFAEMKRDFPDDYRAFVVAVERAPNTPAAMERVSAEFFRGFMTAHRGQMIAAPDEQLGVLAASQAQLYQELAEVSPALCVSSAYGGPGGLEQFGSLPEATKAAAFNSSRLTVVTAHAGVQRPTHRPDANKADFEAAFATMRDIGGHPEALSKKPDSGDASATRQACAEATKLMQAIDRQPTDRKARIIQTLLKRA